MPAPTPIPTDLALIRLLHLVSPALPIGMYSYSQGMERAVEDGWVATEQQAAQWLDCLLERSLAKVDVPLLARLHAAWERQDESAVAALSERLTACRETSELRAEDRQTGQALARLLVNLGVAAAEPWMQHPKTTLATSYTLAAVGWHIPCHTAAQGYLWAWLENQVLCAVKLIPLGQTAGQRLLLELASRIPAITATGLALDDEAMGGSSLGLALASSRHETQYSRLFRS